MSNLFQLFHMSTSLDFEPFIKNSDSSTIINTLPATSSES